MKILKDPQSGKKEAPQPSRIFVAADGSGFVKDLRWTGWGQATAAGSGILEVDNCNPDCAEGTFTGYPATVTLTGLTPCGNDKQAYASMTVSAPDSPYKPQTFTAGLVPQPSA